MQIIKTSQERNIRYTARKNPGVVVEHATPLKEGGFEWLYYVYPITNSYYPHLQDGITVDIVWHAGYGCWLLESCAITPDRFRCQYGKAELYKTYEVARCKAFQEITRLHNILKSDYWKEWPTINITRKMWDDTRECWKEVKKDGTKLIRMVGAKNILKKYNDFVPNTEYFKVNIITDEEVGSYEG